MDFFAEFVRDWEQMRQKLDDHEITKKGGFGSLCDKGLA